jgi:hypothetical protein
LPEDVRFYIDEKEFPIKEENIYSPFELPVTVFAIWGIRRTTFEMLRWSFTIFGFILTFPLITKIIENRIKKKKHKHSNKEHNKANQPAQKAARLISGVLHLRGKLCH